MNNKLDTAIQIDRVWAMPNKNTFSIKPIHNLIEEEITEGLWIDPFANENKFATITNDLNPKFNTDYHIDALEFLKHSKLCFNEDIIINSNGPIVKLVNEKFKRYGTLIIPPVKYYYDLSKGFLHMRKVPYKCKIDKKDRLILINVILKCCSCTTSELIQCSSISASKISMYYRSNNISGENLFKFFSKNNNWR